MIDFCMQARWKASNKKFSGIPEAGLREPSMIAVVDDDRLVRESVVRLVTSLGYDVEAFETAADYLRSGQLSQTACLIADMQMPGMTGLELHARLLALGHEIRTILMTAYPDKAVRAQALNNGVRGYVVKPFREGELIAYVRSAVDRRPAGEGD